MSDPDVRLEQMIQRLRDNDYRITPQRLAILKILAESKGHPSVERIYDQVRPVFTTTSLATVYKNVSILKALGEVLELGFSDDSNRYDGNKPQPHPHLVCTICKEIVDPDLETLKDVEEELQQETGYRVVHQQLDFFGICPACQKRG